MKVRDLMTTELVTTRSDAPLKEAARTMVQAKVSGLPVVDDGELVGMVTEGDFLRQEANRDEPYRFSILHALFGDQPQASTADLVSEVMTREVITITEDASLSEAARIMATRRVKRLPVVSETGELVGVISRADVVNAFTKPDEVIEDEVREDIVRRLLFRDPDTIQVKVTDGVVNLGGVLENRTEALLLEELTRRVDGVIRVTSTLSFEVDDRRADKRYPLN